MVSWIITILLSHPGIRGVTLCFCTSSHAVAGAAAGRRFLFTQKFLNNFLDFFHFWHDCWPWPIDYLVRFWSIFVVTLTLNFQGQIWNLLYLSQKWSDCHETKSKHIDWILGLKCDHRVWPWPWPWPCIFKVKYGICYISAKNDAIATKQRANISIDLKASNVTIGCDLGHDLDLEFWRSNIEFAIPLPKMVRLPQNEKQIYQLNSWPQMWPSDLTLAMTLQGQIWNLLYLNQKWSDCQETKKQTYRLNSRPQMWPMGLTLAMTLIFEFLRSDVTIWWPGSGVRICQIVTGVTSDVGVPSTHLVFLMVIHIFGKMVFILKHGPAWKGLMKLPFYFFQANVFTLILMIISYGHPIYIHYWTRQQRRQLGNHRSTIYKPAEEPQEEVSPLKPDVETWYCFKGDMMFQIKTFLSSLYLNLFVTYFGTVELVVYCVIH